MIRFPAAMATWLSGFLLTTPLTLSTACQRDDRPVDPAAIAELAGPATVREESIPLRNLLPLLQPGGWRLECDDGLRLRRLTLFARSTSRQALLAALARAVPASWVRLGPRALRLRQTQSDREKEQSWIRASRDRSDREAALCDAALSRATERALGDPADERAVTALLRLMNADERELAWEAAREPQGIIGASDNRHARGNLVGVRRLGNLPPDVQERVSQAVGVGADGRRAESLRDAEVGIVAQNGRLGLGVIDPERRDVWISPGDAIGRGGIPGVDGSNNVHPEVADALASQSTLVILRPFPAGLRPLKFDRTLERTLLHVLLRSIHQQTGIAIVSDDYLRSRQIIWSWMLTDRPEYTLPQALRQIGGAFAHQFTYRSGILECLGLVPGRDRRCEPPAELYQRCRELEAERRDPTLADYLAAAALAHPQFNTVQLQGQGMTGTHTRSLFQMPDDLRTALRLYASLTPEQQTKAVTPGLLDSEMTPEQRRLFGRLTLRGLPLMTVTASTQPRGSARFEISPGRSSGLQRWTATAVPRTHAPACRWTLETNTAADAPR